MAITDGYKYIKVNKTDANGLNNASTLGGMTQLRITFSDNTYNDYQIVSLIDNGDYYTFRVTGDECGEKDNNVPDYEDMNLQLALVSINAADLIWDWPSILTPQDQEDLLATYYWPCTGSTTGGPWDDLQIPIPDEWETGVKPYYSLGKTTQPEMKLQGTNFRVTNTLQDDEGNEVGLTCSFGIFSNEAGFQQNIGDIPNNVQFNPYLMGVGRLGEVDYGTSETFNPTWQVGDVDFGMSGSYKDSLISGSGFCIVFYFERTDNTTPTVGEITVVCDELTTTGKFSWENQSPIGITSDATLCIYSPDVISIEYINSNYNPILNNVSDNELNSFVQVVDYDDGVFFPSNFTPIIEDNAEKAQVPDSFFTQKASILPRYEGCELTSRDYNVYNLGDVSYGKTAVIDSNPKYFAHFTKASPTLEDIGSLEFYLDYLIPIDVDIDDSITSFNQIPGLIKLSGEDTFLYEVSQNFQPNRRCAIDFISDTTTTENDPKGIIEWGSLEDISHPIIGGGLEFQSLVSNIAYPSNTLNQLIPTMSDQITTTGSGGSSYATLTNPDYWSTRNIFFKANPQLNPSLTSSYDNYRVSQKTRPFLGPAPGWYGTLTSQSLEYIITGSNKLKLGGDLAFPGFPFAGTICWVTGLSLPELINKRSIENNEKLGPESLYKYKGDDYWKVGTWFPGYKSNKYEFPLQYGDQIQMVSSSGELVTFTINCTSSYLTNINTTGILDFKASTFDVFPDPTLFEFTQNSIASGSSGVAHYHSGSVSLFNIRKRTYVDNKIVLDVPEISNMVTSGSVNNTLNTRIPYLQGSTQDSIMLINIPRSPMGNNFSSPSGYLIPNDFSQEQQEKVGKIIAVLKGNNVFT